MPGGSYARWGSRGFDTNNQIVLGYRVVFLDAYLDNDAVARGRDVQGNLSRFQHDQGIVPLDCLPDCDEYAFDEYVTGCTLPARVPAVGEFRDAYLSCRSHAVWSWSSGPGTIASCGSKSSHHRGLSGRMRAHALSGAGRFPPIWEFVAMYFQIGMPVLLSRLQVGKLRSPIWCMRHS